MPLSNIRNLVLLAALTFLFSGCAGSHAITPPARNGVIDLSGVDILHSEPMRLDGEWAFYWKRLLTPDDFGGPHPPAVSAYLSLPGSWNGVRVDGEELGGKGYATFRLLILTGPVHGDLALRLRGVNSACRLWVDGKLLAEIGVVGKDRSGETPAQSVQIAGLPLDGRPVDLVLQVSNYHYREGGVVASIELGSAKQLESAQLMLWGLTLFCIGSLLVMGLYHVVLFCFRRKNTAPLYFGFYCLLWTGYLLTSTSNDWVVNLLFNRIPVPLLNRVDLLCFVISVPVAYAFFRTLYPEEFSMRLQQATWAMAAVFTCSGLALPTMTFTSIIPVYYLFSSMMIFYSLVRLFAAMRRKRQGALFILLGCVAIGSAGLNDMLYDMQLIRSVYLVPLGMFVFILFQALALSLRFSRAFTAVEWLSDALADKNLSLETEMAERTRLELEIVNVSEAERRSISHDLHDGLCQLLTGARLHFSALRRKVAGAEDQPVEWRQLSSLLEESVNLAYDLSRGLWPVDHDPHGITPSLEELTLRLSESSGIAIEFRQRSGCAVCSNAAMTQLFRIAQEAITNAVRHARPGRIVVGFECADRKTITLTVCDDGIGRNNGSVTKGGLGLRIMAHRARIIGGGLAVSDREGGGTVVTCIAPCEVYSTEDSN